MAVMSTRTVPGVVLAGGKSSRMGTDKSILVVDGMRLVDRALRALEQASITPLFVSGMTAASLASHITAVPDQTADQGPLAGIVATWAHVAADPALAPADLLVVLSCDLPQIGPSLVRELVEAATSGVDAAVAHDGHRRQPLVAAYTASALHTMTAAWADGERSVRRLFPSWTVAEVAAQHQATDADEPADLDRHEVVWPADHEIERRH